MPNTDGKTALRRVEFPGGYDSRNVRPLISADTKAHYDALARRQLLLPQCGRCGRVRVPGGPTCPWCACEDTAWVEGCGEGHVHSWVRYHRAYLPEFERLVPYVVLAVKLKEGPVFFGRSLSADVLPEFGQPARGVVECWVDGFCGLAFELLGADQ